MTLEKTWQKCLKMWRQIVKEWKENRYLDVEVLKENWLQKNDPDVSLLSDCYFCNYDDNGCNKCPGRLVSPSFDCTDDRYNFEYHPDKFLQKLEQLNRKRKDKSIKKGKI